MVTGECQDVSVHIVSLVMTSFCNIHEGLNLATTRSQLRLLSLQHLQGFLLTHAHHGSHLCQALLVLLQDYDLRQRPALAVQRLFHHNMVVRRRSHLRNTKSPVTP